jgi:hypothetical protein
MAHFIPPTAGTTATAAAAAAAGAAAGAVAAGLNAGLPPMAAAAAAAGSAAAAAGAALAGAGAIPGLGDVLAKLQRTAAPPPPVPAIPGLSSGSIPAPAGGGGPGAGPAGGLKRGREEGPPGDRRDRWHDRDYDRCVCEKACDQVLFLDMGVVVSWQHPLFGADSPHMLCLACSIHFILCCPAFYTWRPVLQSNANAGALMMALLLVAVAVGAMARVAGVKAVVVAGTTAAEGGAAMMATGPRTAGAAVDHPHPLTDVTTTGVGGGAVSSTGVTPGAHPPLGPPTLHGRGTGRRRRMREAGQHGEGGRRDQHRLREHTTRAILQPRQGPQEHLREPTPLRPRLVQYPCTVTPACRQAVQALHRSTVSSTGYLRQGRQYRKDPQGLSNLGRGLGRRPQGAGGLVLGRSGWSS